MSNLIKIHSVVLATKHAAKFK